MHVHKRMKMIHLTALPPEMDLARKFALIALDSEFFPRPPGLASLPRP